MNSSLLIIAIGKTDDEAVAGFMKRTDGLIAFSKERAERAKPFVVSGDHASTEPIGLETSRVAADLLFTLGHLAEQTGPDAASVCGDIASTAAPGLELIPAKVTLLGTTISTLAESHARYELHALVPGRYRRAVSAPAAWSLSRPWRLRSASRGGRFDAGPVR